jgi:hypothetical protein
MNAIIRKSVSLARHHLQVAWQASVIRSTARAPREQSCRRIMSFFGNAARKT